MRPSKVHMRQAVGRTLAGIGRRTPQPGTLTVLMYHAVTADRFDDAGQMSVSADRFSAHLDEIASSGARVVDVIDGVTAVLNGTLTDAAVSLVFDDGFVGVHDCAAAALGTRKFPATVFVTTAWIGKTEMPMADRRLGRPMTWAEVEALDRAGISIGSHTDTHPRMTDLGRDELHAELERSRQAIADHVGHAPVAFAYPFGAFGTFDARTRAALDEHGFQVGCTSVFGRNHQGADPLEIRRVRVSWCDGDGEIRRALAGCYDWYRWVQRVQTMMDAGSKRTRPADAVRLKPDTTDPVRLKPDTTGQC